MRIYGSSMYIDNLDCLLSDNAGIKMRMRTVNTTTMHIFEIQCILLNKTTFQALYMV